MPLSRSGSWAGSSSSSRPAWRAKQSRSRSRRNAELLIAIPAIRTPRSPRSPTEQVSAIRAQANRKPAPVRRQVDQKLSPDRRLTARRSRCDSWRLPSRSRPADGRLFQRRGPRRKARVPGFRALWICPARTPRERPMASPIADSKSPDLSHVHSRCVAAPMAATFRRDRPGARPPKPTNPASSNRRE